MNVPCSSGNIREIRSALHLLHANRKVTALMVGYETLYRRDFSTDQLTEIIRLVKHEAGGLAPVSTGDIFKKVRDSDDDPATRRLASARSSTCCPTGTVSQARMRSMRPCRLTRNYASDSPARASSSPNSDGPAPAGTAPATPQHPAGPGRRPSCAVSRFAQTLGINYSLIEAYDQPWIAETKAGSAGVHWGLFNDGRRPKFAWAGPLPDPENWKIAAVAVAVGLLLSLPILGMARATLALAALLSLTAHIGGVIAATVFHYG